MSGPRHDDDAERPGLRLYTGGMSVTSNDISWSSSTLTTTPRAICPDLLSIRDLGEADGWRGHVVRGFFGILRKVTGV